MKNIEHCLCQRKNEIIGFPGRVIEKAYGTDLWGFGHKAVALFLAKPPTHVLSSSPPLPTVTPPKSIFCCHGRTLVVVDSEHYCHGFRHEFRSKLAKDKTPHSFKRQSVGGVSGKSIAQEDASPFHSTCWEFRS